MKSVTIIASLDRSHSSLCQLGPQAAVPARAVAGLVQGGARSWTPCPFGKELDGERAELSPSPWHALLTLSLPRGRPSQPSGADLPSPAPRPLGLHNGWGMGTSSSSSGPGLAEMGTLLPLTNQAVPGATFQEVKAGKSCHLPSPGQVGGFWSGHRDVLRSIPFSTREASESPSPERGHLLGSGPQIISLSLRERPKPPLLLLVCTWAWRGSRQLERRVTRLELWGVWTPSVYFKFGLSSVPGMISQKS